SRGSVVHAPARTDAGGQRRVLGLPDLELARRALLGVPAAARRRQAGGRDRRRRLPEGHPSLKVRALGQLLLAAAGLLLVPLGLRAANRLHPAPALHPSYLPALYGPRERNPFDAGRVEALSRMNPGLVVIG